MDQIQSLRQSLQSTTDIAQVKKVSTDLKKIILKLGLYQITTKDLDPTNPSLNELVQKLQAVRDAFEDITLSLAKFGDVELFERNYNQVRPYYRDFKHLLPPSQNSAGIISLYLLSLLTTVPSRLSDFHCEVEYLSPEELTHPHISTILRLEQALMEGSYSRVLQLKKEIDAIPNSQHFTSQLEALVIDNTLSVVKASSSTYPLSKLAALFSTSEQEVTALAEKQGWQVVDGVVLINDTSVSREEYTSQNLISDLIDISINIDKIV